MTVSFYDNVQMDSYVFLKQELINIKPDFKALKGVCCRAPACEDNLVRCSVAEKNTSEVNEMWNVSVCDVNDE